VVTFFWFVIWPILTLIVGYGMGVLSAKTNNVADAIQRYVERNRK
jgi:hypothetical protein